MYQKIKGKLNMYDYRDDVIKLMKSTLDTEQSLTQSIQALDLIVKVYKDSISQVKPSKKKIIKSQIKKVAPKKETKVKNSSKKKVFPKQHHLNEQLHSNVLYVPQLDFDLHNKTIALVYTQDKIGQTGKKIIKAHNGQGLLVGNEEKDTILSSVATAEVVVAVKDNISSEIYQKLINAKQKDHLNLFVAKTANSIDIEKALYRAENKLPVKDKINIKYPSANLNSLLLASKGQQK